MNEEGCLDTRVPLQIKYGKDFPISSLDAQFLRSSQGLVSPLASGSHT